MQSERELAELKRRESELDPSNTGWDSEAFHNQTQARLKELAAAIEAGESLDRFVLDGGGEAGSDLRPRSLRTVFEAGGMRISRGDGTATGEAGPKPLLEGLQLLVDSLKSGQAPEIEVRFKQYLVSPPKPDDPEASTTALYKARASSEAGERVQNATWEITWAAGGGVGEQRIKAIRVKDFEEIEFDGSSGRGEMTGTESRIFRERTGETMGANSRVATLIKYGANEMIVRSIFDTRRALIGIALGDANGDGQDDVFAPQAEGLPNLFFLSQPDGTVLEQGGESGLDWLDATTSALFADFDNDGDQDLVVATRSRLIVLANEDGTGLKFSRVAEFPQQDTSSVCSADYDGDGLLDLYVCNYLSGMEDQAVVLPDAVYNGTDGGSNRLYRNTGSLTFVEVTEETGMDVDAKRLSLAASWEDFDNDGDVDLYVANDFGPNSLYRNDGGRFAQIAAAAGADDPSTGMSITWGDIDRDGKMDACIGNMFSAAGNRVTMQPKFGEDLTAGLELDRVRYLARGNTLLMNKGSESFDERSEQAGVVNTQWTWATLMADLDNSGALDMLAMNGYVTGPDPDDL